MEHQEHKNSSILPIALFSKKDIYIIGRNSSYFAWNFPFVAGVIEYEPESKSPEAIIAVSNRYPRISTPKFRYHKLSNERG